MDPVLLGVKRIQDKKRKIWSKPKNRWTALAHFRVVFGFLILSRSLHKFEIWITQILFIYYLKKKKQRRWGGFWFCIIAPIFHFENLPILSLSFGASCSLSFLDSTLIPMLPRTNLNPSPGNKEMHPLPLLRASTFLFDLILTPFSVFCSLFLSVEA